MRNVLLVPFVLSIVAVAPGCDDNNNIDDFDDADEANADGESLGSAHAREVSIDFADDSDELVISKSAAIMIAIDENAILLADFALQFAIEPIVLDYADFEIDEHAAHLDAIDQLLFDFDLIPIESPTSDALISEGDGILRNLSIAFDVDFEYMRAQVSTHAEGFVIVDELVTQSPFAEWTRFFEDTLLFLDDHRTSAELILRGL